LGLPKGHAKEIEMTTASGHTSAIRAKKVIGTAVKNSAGQKIGQVEDIVLDKTSNKIIYAVVGFGGFLGMNEKFHPLPWSSLDYQKGKDGYVVGYSKDQLKAAPAEGIDELTMGDGDALRDRVYDYYNAPRYWQ
jgi:sporulation protein YlmC with PRC-barrel domain